MRILCRHGHFALYPERPGEPSNFARVFKAELVREGDYYTFAALAGLPRYSIVGKSYGARTATVTYEGRGPWDVLRQNGFVYSLAAKALVPNASIAVNISPVACGEYVLSQTPLLQPGSRLPNGQAILSYDALLDIGPLRLRLEEFGYV